MLALGGVSLVACRPGTITVAFRPRPGARYRYHVVVRTDSTLTVTGQPARHTSTTVTVDADQVVVSSAGDGTQVQVALRFATGESRQVVIRLDRASQLVGFDAQPGSSLGGLGVAEVFPTAAASPPDHPLRPGERWSVDKVLELPDSVPTRLTGHGRLSHLGVDGGRRSATVATVLDLPVVRHTEDGGRESVLEGVQHTELTTTHAVTDGVVQRAVATTTADYALRLLPPAGVAGPVVLGSLHLIVHSVTSRSA